MILLAFESLSILISVMQFGDASLMNNSADLFKVSYRLIVASEPMLFSFSPAAILFKVPFPWVYIS